MKYNINKTIVRGLIFILLISLLGIPALAAGISMDLSETSGLPGDSVTVSGTAGSGRWIGIKMVGEDGSIVYYNAVLSESEGRYSDTFKIPDLDPGDVQIIAGYGSTVASETYTVKKASGNNDDDDDDSDGDHGSPDNTNGAGDNSTGAKEDITIEDTLGNTVGGAKTEMENGVKVTIPRGDFDKLAGESDGWVPIDLGIARVTFNGKAMDNISGSSDPGDISLSVERADPSTLPAGAQKRVGNRPVFDFTLMAGNTQISDLGGKATVSIPYTLRAGETPSAVLVYYIDDSGNLKAVRGKYNAETGTVDFTVTHFSVYGVGYHEVTFNDVADTDWYYDAVSFCAAREVTNGTGNGLFGPGETLTRGQFITMLMRAYEIESDIVITDNFDDAGNTYYTGYLAAAKRLGISSGIGDNQFAPERSITRQDMFTLLYRALDVLDELPETDGAASLADFGDEGIISDYAKEAMRALVEGGIISGDGITLDPLGGSTRAQMAQVLYNLLSK